MVLALSILYFASHLEILKHCQFLDSSVYGDFGGSRYCLWSEKLRQCISVALLPITCSFGRCGQLYSKSMRCPIPCEKNINCTSCLKHAHCGWCAEGNKGKGKCLPGSLTSK